MLKKKKDEQKVFVAFRRHIYQGKLFEIGDELPEGMKPGYGFKLSDEVKREKFKKVELEAQKKLSQSDHSISPRQQQKIRWKGSEKSLIILVDLLLAGEFIDEEYKAKKYVFIAEHFVNIQGKAFNPKQLSVSAQQESKSSERKIVHMMKKVRKADSES